MVLARILARAQGLDYTASMNLLRIALITAVLQTGSTPQILTASLEGVVVEQATGRPLAGAIVELTGIPSPETGPRDWRVRSFSTVSGVDGKFLLSGVPPGTAYHLTATRSPDFVAGVHGQTHPDDSWVPIALNAGQQLTSLRVSLTALSSISGRVVNPEGKPQKGERVMALTVRYRDGHRVLESESAAYTDSQGNYRIAGLSPGRYVVRIRPVIRASARSLKTGSEAASLYFPDTLDPDKAGVIDVGRTASIEDVNLTTAEIRLRRVRGTINDAETGRLVPNSRVFLVPALASPDSSLTREIFSDNGEFDFREVPPGKYTLFASAGDLSQSLSGRLPITVEILDQQELRIPIQRDLDVEGRITVESPASMSSLDFSQAVVRLSTRSLATVDVTRYPGVLADGRTPVTPPLQATPSALGVFTLKGLRHWPYFADAAVALGANVYVKSIHFGNTSPMQIVLGTDGATISGRIVDGDRNAMPYAAVVLIPDEQQRDRRYLYRTTRTDPGGRFSVQGIAPGNYKVFAWRVVDAGAWFDPEFLRPHEKRALSVTLGPLETKSVEALVLFHSGSVMN
jgi:hypothetical protein